jgi:hypothetical protein
MAHLAVFTGYLPMYIGDPFSGAINAIEGVKGDFGITLIHEIAEITILDLGARISEYATEGVVEKHEITLKIDFVKPIGNIFDEHAVAVFLNSFLFRK